MKPTRPFDDVPALLEALSHLADADPERPALTAYRGRTVTGRLTYGELLHRVAGAQHNLTTALGLSRGDLIAVLSPNRLEVPVLYLAALGLGIGLVPLNPTTPPEDWKYAIEHAGARLLILAGELFPQVPPLPIPICRVEEIATPTPPGGPRPMPTGDDLAVILYTSGTTGNPKGVALSQRNVLANAWSMARNFGLDRSTQLAVLPLYHAHAFGFGLMSALVTGGHLVLAERFDPFAWTDVIRHEAVTVTSVVPTLLPPLLEARVHAERVPTLRALLVSSAPLAPRLAREFEERTKIPLIHGWGLSEYTNFACCLSPNLPDDQRRALLTGGELSSIGSPLEGVEVKAVDKEGRALGPDERGELCIRGPSRMIGYFHDQEATVAAVDPDGWLRTGDEGLYRLHGDRPVFFVTGRLKEIIIRGGEKVSPLAVERKLLSALPELDGRLVVVGFPHVAQGEEVGAYLELESLDDLTRSRLVAALDTLSPDLRPKVVLNGSTPIPRTHTGKIQRRRLQPLFAKFSECRGPVLIAPV